MISYTGVLELYWNVTGNDWMFPTDYASARIELPEAVDQNDLQTDFYTGWQGSIAKNATSYISSARKIEFQTTQGLQAREGLTIAVAWPKGIVNEPTATMRVNYFLQDNGAALVLLIGLLAPLGWYLWAWNLYGRDPRKGVIIPRFKPPGGLMTVSHLGSKFNSSFSSAVSSASSPPGSSSGSGGGGGGGGGW